MGSYSRRQRQRRTTGSAPTPLDRHRPDPAAADSGAVSDEMAWLAPQALPWLQADKALPVSG